MTRAFLVRHGQSQWNGTKRVSGQLDPPLTAKGCQQAHCLMEVLHHEKLSAIYTNPLRRAVETAKPTAATHGLTIQAREALKKIHHWVVQGRFRDDSDPAAKRLWQERGRDKIHYRIPGAETFLELESRVIAALNKITKKERSRTVLIVGHRDTNRVILSALMQWPREVSSGLALRRKYLYEIVPGQVPQISTILLDRKRGGLKGAGFKVQFASERI